MSGAHTQTISEYKLVGSHCERVMKLFFMQFITSSKQLTAVKPVKLQELMVNTLSDTYTVGEPT